MANAKDRLLKYVRTLLATRDHAAIHWTVALALFPCVVASAAPENASPRPSPRYKALAKVIDRNVGHAHMTRGVNACTILALRDQVTDEDIEFTLPLEVR